MEALINDIDKRCNLSEAEKTLLRRTLRTLHFPKGSVVFRKGQIDDSIYFIEKGVWRAFIERDGEHQTLWFAIPNETVFSSWGIMGRPSRYTVSSSSDSIAVEMKKSTIVKLSESSPQFMNWLHELYVSILIGIDDLFVDISSPKAEKRYLAFMKKCPKYYRVYR